MEPHTRIERSGGVFTAPIENELVLMSPALDGYLAMDEVGRRIWEILEHPLSVDDLCRKLAEEYDGPPERISGDVGAFLDRLAAKGLVHVSED